MLLNEISNFYLLADTDGLRKRIYSLRSHKKVIIANKHGKLERTVYVPSSTVKMCQHYILDNYLSELKYSKNAVAYTKGISIVDNARRHSMNSYFLHVDIKHYFNSMNWNYFCGVINRHFPSSKIRTLLENNDDKNDLKRILTFRNIFRQGSVTSPFVSNIYLFEFDIYVDKLVHMLPNGIYTRYSDDIYISSSVYIPIHIFRKIEKYLNDINLKINYKKLNFSKLNDSQRITGVTITKKHEIIINTKYKKSLKGMIYKVLNGKNNSIDFNKLFGKLYYLMMVDIDYFNYLQIKYSDGKNTMMARIIFLEKDRQNNNSDSI